MFSTIVRKLNTEEIQRYVEIVINAYPGFSQNTEDYKERFTKRLVDIQENEPSLEFYGLFRDGNLLGGMRIHYYTMNLFSKMVEVGGVGLVAVDLLHKKEKVAKEMIEGFIEHFQKKGTSLVMLYPFRPDFYKKMGFGYGPKMNHYEIDPLSFPNGKDKSGLLYLNAKHKNLIKDCYDSYARSTHGMFVKNDNELEAMFKNPDNKFVGVFENEKLQGYINFSFEKGGERNFLDNHIVVKELIYHNPLALTKICTFLHNQADQIKRIIFNTVDPTLEFLLDDARNGSGNLIPPVYHETNTSGVGLMYRVINLSQLVEDLQGKHFGEDCSFKLRTTDTLLSEENEVLMKVQNGKLTMVEKDVLDFDFEVELDISDFSSLVMGAVDAYTLYNYGKLRINNEYHLKTLFTVFHSPQKPICMTGY